MKNIAALLVLFLGALDINAQQTDVSFASSISFYHVMLGIIIILTIVLLLTVFVLHKAVFILKKETLGEKYNWAEEYELTTWEKLLSLKPLAAEKDIELDHNFDGIKELNNPIPPWFNVLFIGTIIFAVGYLFVFHIFGIGDLQAKEYDNELAQAKIQKEEYIKKVGNLIDENNVTLITDTKLLEPGKQIYISKCVVCHGENGEGKVGPNLTDEYWLHGGTIKDLFKTIEYGVPSKGMVAWANSLKPNEIQEVASYVLSLQGTNPIGAKEPQGEKALSAAAPTDSLKVDSMVKK